MEIRVKVDGEDKIVRGVTNQITVENVIVAVAETTGRKGRYTLVRKSPNCERILTPTDKIIEILKKKKTKDTIFELKKTTDLEINEETVLPERSSKRKSLPPKLKHRPNAVSSNRNSRFHHPVSNDAENARMRPASALGSLISGDDTLKSSYTQSFDNSLQSSSISRSTLPTRFQNNEQTRSLPRADRRGNVLNKIAAINGLYSPAKSRHNTEKPARHQPAATLKPRPISMGSEPKTTLKPLTRTNQAALDEFKRLVSAQHSHIHEQTVTLYAVDKELQKAEVEWKNGNIKRCNQEDVQNIKLQIKQLEATVSNNEAALRSEQALLDRLNEDEQEAYTREMDVSKVQEDIKAIEKSLQSYKENAVRLQQDIERERKKQKERQQRAIRDAYKIEIKKLQDDNSRVANLSRATETAINKLDAEVYEKTAIIDKLNKELRQVSLQQFIHKTGSKVSVLPAENQTDLSQKRTIPQIPESPREPVDGDHHWV